MPNILRLTAEDPDDLLNAGAYGAGALIRVQSASSSAGPFADLSGTGSTPTVPLVAEDRFYTAFDPNGTSSTWYQTRFENAGGTRASDWTAPFQVGDETEGQLCSLDDVEQALGGVSGDADRETILEYIGQVTREIEGFCGRWFTPRPLSGSMTLTFDGPRRRPGRQVLIPKGIRSIDTNGLEVATVTGSSYSVVPTSGFFIRPGTADRNEGWPGTSVKLSDVAGVLFWPGYDTIRITGGFGFAAAPLDLQGVAQRTVIRRFIGKESATPIVAAGPDGHMVLRGMSPEDTARIEWYAHRGPR